MQIKNKPSAIFLDRDGVIIEDVSYLSDPSQVTIIPGSGEAIAQINQAEIPVIVVTNQSGVARGYFKEEMLTPIHNKMRELLQSFNAYIDLCFYCPHHPNGAIPKYTCKCRCRKPAPGMLLKAADELDICLKTSYIIGDKKSDLDAGASVGANGFLVLTGEGKKNECLVSPEQVVPDLATAINIILS